LAWTRFLISHQSVGELRLVAELRSHLATRQPILRDLSEAALHHDGRPEARRDFSACGYDAAHCREEDESAIFASAGQHILMIPYLTHRLADLWD